MTKNWYKISTHNIKFPDEKPDEFPEEQFKKYYFHPTIDSVVKEIVQYYQSRSNIEDLIGDLEIANPYTKEIMKIPIILNPDQSVGDNAKYNPHSPNGPVLMIFPYRIGIKIKSKNDINNFANAIKETLIHELTHISDPKISKDVIRECDPDKNFAEYVNSDHEFDAFSKQILERIKSDQNEKNKNEIINWIRSSNLYPLPGLLLDFNLNCQEVPFLQVGDELA